mmetsp:Transcript_58072/g.101657  ORF Transcript_58072/g.101657 Transcript_58072/m.101657 type:complete len:192 (-) Transcript_58072:97-672(-)
MQQLAQIQDIFKGMLENGNSGDYHALAGMGGACAMVVLGALSVFDLELSTCFWSEIAQVIVLTLGGLICLQGERNNQTQMLSQYASAVQDFFGFAMTALGRAAAYFLAALHCIGVRAMSLQENHEKHVHNWLFVAVWYLCCLALLAAGSTSVMNWRIGQKPGAFINTEGNGPDADAYYSSYEPPSSSHGFP